MKTARVGVCLAILLSWTITSPLFAQAPPGTRVVQGDDESPDSYDFFGPRNIQSVTNIGDGVGYSKGYQTFGAFQSLVLEPDELIFFLNPRGIITYLGDVAANAGLGVRWYDEDSDRIWGGSVWYDTDNTGKFKYDQIGISLESLGKYVDFRVNGYMPTNDDRDISGQFLNGTTTFFQNFIGIGRTTQYSTPLKGGDFELGGLLPGIGDRGIRPYVGGYYYQGEGTGAAYGFKGRLETLITQDLWAQVLVSNDRLFGTNVMGSFTWYYGSGQAPRWFQRQAVQDRLYYQVERQYRIAVYEEVFNDAITALRTGGVSGSAGGAAGTPILVLHVDNSAPAGGDGTVEHPLNFLPTNPAQHFDIVFVNRGTGSTFNYDRGTQLSDWQRLLGQGVQHNFVSQQGTFLLPGFSSGPLPRITNPNGDVVKLANNNEVSGFNIVNAGRHGIFGSGMSNFNINNVNIFDSHNAGIMLTNATGQGQVFDSQMRGNGAEGLRINNIGGDLQLRLDRVDASANNTGISLVGSGAANFNVIFRDVNASDNATNGIEAALDTSASIVGLFERVTASNNGRSSGGSATGDGVRITANNSVASLIIGDSNFDGNNLSGVNVIGNNSADIDIDLLSNNFRGNQTNGAALLAADSNSNFTVRNSTLTDNGGFGIYTNARSGTLNLIADDNQILRNHGAGIAYRHDDHGTGTLEIQRNLITGTLAPNPLQDTAIYFGQAIDIRLGHNSNIVDGNVALTSGLIRDNTIGDDNNAGNGNVGGGIFAFVDQRSTLANVTIDHNLIANNGGDGIHFVRLNEATVDKILIDTNSIHNNRGNGIFLSASDSPNDVNDYVMRNNNITRNLGNGVSFFIEADAGLQADMFDNIITFNGANGIFSNENVNSVFDLRFLTGTWERNVVTNNALDGFQSNGHTSNLLIGSLTTEANGNFFNDNARMGMQINNSGTMFIGWNEVARNNGGGLDMNVLPFFFAQVNNNFIHNNRAVTGDGDGIEFTDAGLGTVVLSANFNTIRDNAGRGVDILNSAHDQGAVTTMQVTMDSNLIVGNNLEGVFVMNTSATQSQSNNITNAPAIAPGLPGIFALPSLFFTFTNNRVEGNGSGRNLLSEPATGLVLRVGTSGGGYDFTDDGGFFSEGRSGVGATITGNIFHGNNGDDIYMDSFVSTIAPPATGGVWSQTQFTPQNYRGDPLARLDLVFQNNTVDSYGFLNASNLTPLIPSMAGAGAFYNNAEPIFKSRDGTQTDPGPFTNGGARQRNATRLGGRFGLPPATPGGLSDLFLYPGLGQSTFRLIAAPTGNSDSSGPVNPFDGFTLTNSFGGFTDNFYTSPADANGYFNAPPNVDPMPYGWNEFGGNPRPQ